MFTTRSLHKRQAESLAESYLSEIEREARIVSGEEGITGVFDRIGFDQADFLGYSPDRVALDEFTDFTKDMIIQITPEKGGYFSNLVKKGMMNKGLLASLAVLSAVGLVCGCVSLPGIGKDSDRHVKYPDGWQMPNSSEWDISSGWTITSYGLVNEKLYAKEKIQVFDDQGDYIGRYRQDFLDQVKIDGAGVGDGNENSGKIIQYNYNLNDGKTFHLTDVALGAYGYPVSSWTSDRPSVAVNPPLPAGTEIRFVDLGHEGIYNPDWVNYVLLGKTFYSDDTFFNMEGNRLDVYVGLQESLKEPNDQTFLMRNVTVAVRK